MTARKSLSKKTRFEVFKRDHFTCQYCGRMAPDVILEVDHIKPVAEGGTNEIINLITSCRDCNRGKGKRKLSDKTELKKQQDELKNLAIMREQTEMMMEWKYELMQAIDNQIECIDQYIASNTDWGLSEHGKATIKKMIRRFSFQEVYDAIEISFDYYYNGSEYSWNKAFNKIGGICYNRRQQRNGDL